MVSITRKKTLEQRDYIWVVHDVADIINEALTDETYVDPYCLIWPGLVALFEAFNEFDVDNNSDREFVSFASMKIMQAMFQERYKEKI